MRLEALKAEPHPAGHRIDLSWRVPDPEDYPWVRVMRRQGSHPQWPDDGTPVAEVSALRFLLNAIHIDDLNSATLSEPLAWEFNSRSIRLSPEAYIVVETPGLKWRLCNPGGTEEDLLAIRYIAPDIAVFGPCGLSDTESLKGETVYYYSLFPYHTNGGRHYAVERTNRIAAMASSCYDMAGQMHALLPAIYHRYDKVLPDPSESAVSDQDRQRGQLRRFLDLPGSQLDLLYSKAAAAAYLIDTDKTHGNLLPLLAEWIGWKTDHTLDVQTQRSEIKRAPAIYAATGGVAVLESTVKRLCGWDTRTKEYLHNIVLANTPEQLNFRALLMDNGGAYHHVSTAPLSLDQAYEGRACAVPTDDGSVMMFYHTRRTAFEPSRRKQLPRTCWDIWSKTCCRFPLAGVSVGDLSGGVVTRRIQALFLEQGIHLGSDTAIIPNAFGWQIDGTGNLPHVILTQDASGLTATYWTKSAPLIRGSVEEINKHPAAAMRAGRLWVFWNSYSDADRRWTLRYSRLTADGWSTPVEADQPTGVQRIKPCAVNDSDGNMWLFYLEMSAAGRELRYLSLDHATPDAPPDFSTAEVFPPDAGVDPDVDDDPFVLSAPGHPDGPGLWLFWVMRQPSAVRPGRWVKSIAYRHLVFGGGWGAIHVLAKDITDPDYNDMEPSAIEADGNVQLYWSSDRTGNRALMQAPLDDPEAATELTPESPYSHTAPLPIRTPELSLLIYRANTSVAYPSRLYSITQTVDGRYAGSTTANTRNTKKNGLAGTYDDFRTYTYDTGRKSSGDDRDLFSRETVGLFLNPDIFDADRINAGISRIKGVLKEFIPITSRAVFIPHVEEITEYVYGYDATPGEADVIHVEREATMTTMVSDIIPTPSDGDGG